MDTSSYFVAEAFDPERSGAGRTGRATAELAGQGRRVTLLGSLFSADDELSLHVFRADSAETVAEVGLRASSPFDRIWPAEWIATAAGPCAPLGRKGG